ncbi:MAG TPA: UPF0149 family protein [Rhizobacter sp.]|nr:UPF0149 family protein [Rhizobacter sp.]
MSTHSDLTDAEFAELDELLAETPEPLQPVDSVMLDGFLCGVLVQPLLLEPAAWLPHVFDFDATPLPEDTDPAWRERTTALILRRYGALNRAMAEDGWFNPLILEFDDEHPRELPPEGEPDPLAGLSEISQALMPWVAGFQHATLCFPDLAEMPDDAVMTALARLYRHLPAETAEEREVVETIEREHPLKDMEDAIEDLVVTVADLYDLTRDQRYKVETVKREAPKVGRNDPCPCGSGKKFKQCHGAT